MLDALPFETIGCTVENYKNVLYETVKAGFKFLFRAVEFQLYQKIGRRCVVYFPMLPEYKELVLLTQRRL